MLYTLLFYIFASVIIPPQLASQVPSSVVSEIQAAIPECTESGTDPKSLVSASVINQIPASVLLQITPELLNELAAQIPVCTGNLLPEVLPTISLSNILPTIISQIEKLTQILEQVSICPETPSNPETTYI